MNPDHYGAVGRFRAALPVILRFEGGLADNPSDRGGRTYKGITSATWKAWLTSMDRPLRDVATATDEEIGQIYKLNYWDAVRGDQLPAPLDLVLFDSAVNHGPRTPIKWLQRALGVTADGSIGPQTLQALSGRNAVAVANAVLDQRSSFYDYLVSQDADQRQFLTGWRRRIATLRSFIGGASAGYDPSETSPSGGDGGGGGGVILLGGLALLGVFVFLR